MARNNERLHRDENDCLDKDLLPPETMVAVQRPSRDNGFAKSMLGVLMLAFTLAVFWMVESSDDDASRVVTEVATARLDKELQQQQEKHRLGQSGAAAAASAAVAVSENVVGEASEVDHDIRSICQYSSIEDLPLEDRHPSKGPRHMVDPPAGGNLTLVCCETTKGPWNIVVHHRWAPIGAEHFISMVQKGHFSADSVVPLFRCLRGFLCQFGLSGNPKRNKREKVLVDDPNWLPEGPSHRHNEDGVSRFAQGYLAYAGGGKNSRGNQLIVALEPSGPLAGGSPWEVPWGELVGHESFATLSKIYTGYGENGPSQGQLNKRGVDDEMRKEFPKLDYVNQCQILDRYVES